MLQQTAVQAVLAHQPALLAVQSSVAVAAVVQVMQLQVVAVQAVAAVQVIQEQQAQRTRVAAAAVDNQAIQAQAVAA
jgi:hypothetical protein